MKKILLMLVILAVTVGSITAVSLINKEHIHSFSRKITTPADCTHSGVMTYVCTECGYTYEDKIANGHIYVDTVIPPTYDETGYTEHVCSVCGDKYRDSEVPKLERPDDDIEGAVLGGLEEKYDYTGKEIVPEITVTVKDRVLTAGTDYTLEIKNNKKPGTATVTVTGMGAYKNTLVKTFEIERRGWEEKDGLKYYYNGKELAKGITEIDGESFFFDDEGVMQTGWQKVGDGYYCFDRIDGPMYKNTQIDGINVDKNGLAEESEYNTYKITTMMRAHKIMLEQTDPTDSMEEKRLKVFEWEMYEHGYHRWRLLEDIYDSSPDWEITFANDIFKQGSGCCVSDSCAAAFLIREIGYTDIYICHDTAHCWFTVGGKLFDPLFAEAKDFDLNYNADFTDYRQYPRGRRRVDGVSTDVDEDDGDDEGNEE